MKKQFAFLAISLFTVLFFYTSCSKDSTTTTPPAKTKTELISQSTWKFKTATANGSDVSSYLQACQKDNILTFLAAGTGTADEGATKCNAGDPQTSPFTWNFLSSETMLHISTVLFTGGSSDFTLVSLSATELVVSQNYTPPVGPTILMVVTFQH